MSPDFIGRFVGRFTRQIARQVGDLAGRYSRQIVYRLLADHRIGCVQRRQEIDKISDRGLASIYSRADRTTNGCGVPLVLAVVVIYLAIQLDRIRGLGLQLVVIGKLLKLAGASI
ncbi:hypothetical protein D9M72_454790 [compost metagenome]